MLVLASIAVLWYRPIAGVFTLLGLAIMLRGAYLDRRYGIDRPTKREIGRMSADEYRNRLHDKQFVDWVNNVGFKFPPND